MIAGMTLVLALIGYALLAASARALLEAARVWSERTRTERLQARRNLLAGEQEHGAMLMFAKEVDQGMLRGMPPVEDAN